ncbi:hypothetical protein [Natranaerofaba carboxydovora]|uniref:hypothetical protein n=1 Tax=Natranaerofaba carboxydovora TaxID=2742683 RepID=UPI001F133A10|nr:hypothetical protein [Natranaerofaba carboxydovora]UMZ73043.1 Fluoroquinolones export permease protein [Natranaerofaba carboxydovora]
MKSSIGILIANDIKNITRDAILIMSILAPILFASAIRFVVPIIGELLREQYGFNLLEHYTFIIGFMIVLTPLMIGTLIGFLILDERDEDIITFYSVTPLLKSGYIYYRTFIPAVFNLVFTIILVYYTGVLEVSFLTLVPVVLMASLAVPMMALFLGAFAGNKVEGLALSKGVGIMFFGPVIGYLVGSWWNILAGILPPYWVSMAFLSQVDKVGVAYLFYIVVGIGIHTFIIGLLYKKFKIRI